MPGPLTAVLDPAAWPAFAYVLTRVSGLMMIAPLWSMPTVPARIRVAIGMVLTLALLPAVPPVTLPHLPVIAVSLAVEFIVGLAIGLSAAVVMSGISTAGEIVSLQMGLSMAPALSPLSEDVVPGVGQFKGALALLIYLALDGHLMLLRGLADTFRTLPPGAPPSFESVPKLAAEMLGLLYIVTIKIAAPAMAALFVVNLAVGLTGRAVPQFPALMIVFPVTIAVGLFMLHLALPSLAGTMAGWIATLPRHAANVVAALTGAH